MARISDLNAYNDFRRTDEIWTPLSTSKESIKFTNSNGDDVIISPIELKEELHKFIDQELISQTQGDIERKKEYLKREVDKQLNQFETSLKRHIEDKLNNITERIIESVLERVFEDKVKQEVKRRLNKLLEE
jgi:hemerythrin-like domain-containing protein